MKLLTLTITNFRSWRQAELPLGDLGAAVITGPNGAGKSSVVEALLWTLYGYTRSTGADSVVRIGETDAEGVVTFQVGAQRYRVVRRRSTRGSGRTDLHLFRTLGGDEGEQIAGGAGVRGTQAEINRIIGADLDTMVAASVVLQGDADRFTRARPEARKALLRQVLRLDRWSDLANEARTRARTAAGLADAALWSVPEQPAYYPADVANAVAEARQAREAAEHHLQLAGQKTTDAQAARTEAEADLRAADAQVAQAGLLIRQRDELVTERMRLRRAADVLRIAKEKLARLEEAQAQAASLRVEVASLSEAVAAGELREGRLANEISKLDEAKASCRDRSYHLRREMTAVEGEIRQGEAELARLAADADRAKTAPCLTPSPALAAACPFLAHVRDAAARASETGAALDRARAEMGEVRTQYAAQQLENDRVERDRGEAVEALDTLRLELREQSKRLSRIRAAVALADGADLEAAKQMVADAEASKARLHALQNQFDELEAALAALPNVEALRAGLAQAQRDARNAEQSVAQARADLDRAAGVERDAQAKFAQVWTAAEARRKAEQLAAEYRQTAESWGATAEACTLAPTLVLEGQAIPALEEAANRYLSAFSATGMAVRLDTQRALKSRDGLAETLDIVVRDVVGERAYEDFSGGEQFRIDLALRLALAELLTQRDGPAIDWLVIDEGGFGALDPAGVDAVKATLQGLQALFSLVLVITHIDAVAEALPRRLHVQRHADGATLEIC